MFKLVKDVEVGSAVEEATFIMHGIILKKDLPPIEVERYEACLFNFWGVIFFFFLHI